MIVIVDYGMGNLRSVQKKFQKIGANVEITNDPKKIIKAEKIVLPGVGNFYQGMLNIKHLGLYDVLNESVLKKKTPILGICLGMQLMAKNSSEGSEINGFGWIDAEVVRFNVQNNLKFKVPHIGWNNIFIAKESNLLSNLNNESEYYFVHSFFMQCRNSKDILAKTIYENDFVSAIQKDNIYGTQFHPEKSHDNGQKLISNFVNLI